MVRSSLLVRRVVETVRVSVDHICTDATLCTLSCTASLSACTARVHAVDLTHSPPFSSSLQLGRSNKATSTVLSEPCNLLW